MAQWSAEGQPTAESPRTLSLHADEFERSRESVSAAARAPLPASQGARARSRSRSERGTCSLTPGAPRVGSVPRTGARFWQSVRWQSARDTAPREATRRALPKRPCAARRTEQVGGERMHRTRHGE
eukprot:5319644-Prymnesium_polylepis.1